MKIFYFIHFACAISPMCYNVLVFSCCQGLSKAHILRLRMPSITGSTLIFSTTLHTTWSPFLLPCGPMQHIGTVFWFWVSKWTEISNRQKYQRLTPTIGLSDTFSEFIVVCHNVSASYFCTRYFHHGVERRGSDLRGIPER